MVDPKLPPKKKGGAKGDLIHVVQAALGRPYTKQDIKWKMIRNPEGTFHCTVAIPHLSLTATGVPSESSKTAEILAADSMLATIRDVQNSRQGDRLAPDTETSRSRDYERNVEGSSKKQHVWQPDVDEYDKVAMAYRENGSKRVSELACRGPVVLDAEGNLHPDIMEKYKEFGFYVFTNVVSPPELNDLQAEFQSLMERAPSEKGARVDSYGRSVPHPEIYKWARPLSDPLGGTKNGVFNFRGGKTVGRHHTKMTEPVPTSDAPDYIIERICDPLAHMDAALRLYGHPDILQIAHSINGRDFTPFAENLYIKPARYGSSTSWHQDPSSAWDEDWIKPGFDYDTCGFNLHVSLFQCTAANGLWIVPGSHRGGRVDIKERIRCNGGSDMFHDAVPILCQPGDVYVHNRLALHGSFPNTSDDARVVVHLGFNRRSSVLGVRTRTPQHTEIVYDEAFLHERSKMIVWAIDARRQRFPNQAAYDYQPFSGIQHDYRWGPELKETLYNRMACFENIIAI